MAAAAILKITKIAISPQRFDRSLRNLATLCKMGLLTVLAVKKFEFPKSKMADGRHFEKKTVKSSYLSNRWTDFNKIWHGDARLPATGDRPLKFGIFQKKNKMAAVAVLKNHKNRDITTTD